MTAYKTVLIRLPSGWIIWANLSSVPLDTTLVKNPEDKLQSLLLDLDDDLFWFSFSGKNSPIDFKKMPAISTIELWEVYRTHDSNPLIKVRTTVVTLQKVNIISILALMWFCISSNADPGYGNETLSNHFKRLSFYSFKLGLKPRNILVLRS